MDPRIGVLNSGKCYAYVNGYHAEPVMGTLAEVEIALGIRQPEPAKAARAEPKTYNVLMTFECPAWDEVDGIRYDGIIASSKAEANQRARRQAMDDGHAVGNRGRYWFTATEA